MNPRKRTNDGKADDSGRRRYPKRVKREDPDGKKVLDIMAAIYFDINCVCIFRKAFPDTPEHPDAKWYRFECEKGASFVEKAVRRISREASSPTASGTDGPKPKYTHIVERLDWKLLAICAHSQAFRLAMKREKMAIRNLLIEKIVENRHSLSAFATLRDLEWRNPLMKYANRDLPGLREVLRNTLRHPGTGSYTPHKFVLTQDGGLRPPLYRNILQVHIDENIFNPRRWDPDGTATTPVTDPTLRNDKHGKCYLCYSTEICECTLASLAGTLIELYDTGEMGVGVRSLAKFKKGAVLDAYVGELYPPNRCDDIVYSLQHHVRGGKTPFASISAIRYGNWTRFINHKCEDQLVEFNRRTIGEYTVMTVEALRDIDMFEELTIHYGKEYWGDRECQCGMPNCLSRKEKKLPC